MSVIVTQVLFQHKCYCDKWLFIGVPGARGAVPQAHLLLPRLLRVAVWACERASVRAYVCACLHARECAWEQERFCASVGRGVCVRATVQAWDGKRG